MRHRAWSSPLVGVPQKTQRHTLPTGDLTTALDALGEDTASPLHLSAVVLAPALRDQVMSVLSYTLGIDAFGKPTPASPSGILIDQFEVPADQAW